MALCHIESIDNVSTVLFLLEKEKRSFSIIVLHQCRKRHNRVSVGFYITKSIGKANIELFRKRNKNSRFISNLQKLRYF